MRLIYKYGSTQKFIYSKSTQKFTQVEEFYQIATKAIEKAQENAGMTREYLNQKEMAEYLNVSENFLKNAVRNEGLPVVELGARKFYSKKAVNEFMFARMKRGGSFERR